MQLCIAVRLCSTGPQQFPVELHSVIDGSQCVVVAVVDAAMTVTVVVVAVAVVAVMAVTVAVVAVVAVTVAVVLFAVSRVLIFVLGSTKS